MKASAPDWHRDAGLRSCRIAMLHPAATRNASAHQHNVLRIEVLAFSSGRDIDEFSDLLDPG
jgi:hypothetical protein